MIFIIGLLLNACQSGSPGADTVSEGGGAAPEETAAAQGREIVGRIATLTSEASYHAMGAGFGGPAALVSGGGMTCGRGMVYEDGCLKLSMDCSPEGPAFAVQGQVGFLGCVVETDLGLAGLTGKISFKGEWNLPPACRDTPSKETCASAYISLTESDPVGLTIQFAGGEPMAVTSLDADAIGPWVSGAQGDWKLIVRDLSFLKTGKIVRCGGYPSFYCLIEEPPSDEPVEEPPPEEPPVEEIPPPLDQTCLHLPSCATDDDCGTYLQCPGVPEFLDKFRHELKCIDGGCIPKALPQEAVVPGECARSEIAWGDFCPITNAYTFNGEGDECATDAKCQTRQFALDTGAGDCGNPCFCCEHMDEYSCTEKTQEEYCQACDGCVTQFVCRAGCCAWDRDRDGYVEAYAADNGATLKYGDNCDPEMASFCVGDCRTLNCPRDDYGNPTDPVCEANCEAQCKAAVAYNPNQGDGDQDCIGDACDNCPSVANGVGQVVQADADEDGVGDLCDNCPIVKNGPRPVYYCDESGCGARPAPENQRDTDGDGVGDLCQGDDDGDRIPNEVDNCRSVPNASQANADGDGWGDDCDNCPSTKNEDQAESDGDEIGDACDNCPQTQSIDQTDSDGDAVGDPCDEDVDGDGTPNASDNCPFASNPDQADADKDVWGDLCDNCPETPNAAQFNGPSKAGYACDPDRDGDGVPNEIDNCPFDNPGQVDTDGDGIGDGIEDGKGDCYYYVTADDDYDGVPNIHDLCNGFDDANVPAYWKIDLDGDGVTDCVDNCPDFYNPYQEDVDSDSFNFDYGFCPDMGGICFLPRAEFKAVKSSDPTGEHWASRFTGGDACDDDNDFDSYYSDPPAVDAVDNCPYRFNPDQSDVCAGDLDSDGVPDAQDSCPSVPNRGFEPIPLYNDPGGPSQIDADGDGFGEGCDNCPSVANAEQEDGDFDGIGDACEACHLDGVCDAGGGETSFNCPQDCVVCGDGTWDFLAGEECDDGGVDSGDGCDDQCRIEFCGDGIINNKDEICDTGLGAPNTCAEGESCTASCVCKTPVCGDYEVDPGEECDDGNDGPYSEFFCTSACRFNVCGDGVLGAVEGCDGDDAVCAGGNLPGTAPRFCSDTPEEGMDCLCKGFCGDFVCDATRETAENCCMDCGTAFCDNFNVCGDGVCGDRETFVSCYGDCRLCGDGYCDGGLGEDGANCPVDCVDVPLSCGDDACDPATENTANCYVDCWRCGDQLCDGTKGEGAEACPADCSKVKIVSNCGGGKGSLPCTCNSNGTCEPGLGENLKSCYADCAASCGDGLCELGIGETLNNCFVDCDGCGDGICDSRTENVTADDPGFCLDCHGELSTCGLDAEPDGEFCDAGEAVATCYGDCAGPSDGYCDASLGEDAANAIDCSCGNGVIDAGLGEYCDRGSGDPCASSFQVCNSTCTACEEGGIIIRR